MMSEMLRLTPWPVRSNMSIRSSCPVPWPPAAVNSNFAAAGERPFVERGGAGASTKMGVPAAKRLRLHLGRVSPRCFAHKFEQNVQIPSLLGRQAGFLRNLRSCSAGSTKARFATADMGPGPTTFA